MPRMISTSFITGTGFMKCMPMNFSGRSVAAPSRVIEIDEVLDAIMQAGFRCGISVLEDRLLHVLLLGRRLDHQVALAERGVVGAGRDARQRRRPGPRAMIRLRLTCRSMLRAIVAIALSSGSGFTSSSITGSPASAQTWAMPLPICPAPITPTRAISGGSASSAPPAGVA